MDAVHLLLDRQVVREEEMIHESVHLFGLPGLLNVGRVTESIHRGADPAPGEGYRSLSELGIKTVLNLSHGRDSTEFRPYSIKEIYTPIDFFRDVNDAWVRKLVAVLFDTRFHPIYVHCAQGRDRTGMIIACYRIESGWSNKDAIDEMWSFGFHFIWSHFLEFVQAYKRTEQPTTGGK